MKIAICKTILRKSTIVLWLLRKNHWQFCLILKRNCSNSELKVRKVFPSKLHWYWEFLRMRWKKNHSNAVVAHFPLHTYTVYLYPSMNSIVSANMYDMHAYIAYIEYTVCNKTASQSWPRAIFLLLCRHFFFSITLNLWYHHQDKYIEF